MPRGTRHSLSKLCNYCFVVSIELLAFASLHPVSREAQLDHYLCWHYFSTHIFFITRAVSCYNLFFSTDKIKTHDRFKEMMHIVLETPMVEYSNVARIWPSAKQFPLPLLGNHFEPCHIFHSYLALRTSLELDSYYTRAVLWELEGHHLQIWEAHLSMLSCKNKCCMALLFAT